MRLRLRVVSIQERCAIVAGFLLMLALTVTLISGLDQVFLAGSVAASAWLGGILTDMGFRLFERQ